MVTDFLQKLFFLKILKIDGGGGFSAHMKMEPTPHLKQEGHSGPESLTCTMCTSLVQ